MKKYLLLLIILIPVGCQQSISIGNNNISVETIANTNRVYQKTWQELQPGLNFKEIPIYSTADQTKINDLITIFKFQPDLFTFAFKQQTSEPLAVSEWREKYNSLFVCNGGYFLENNQPAELLKINSEKFGTNLTSASVGELVINDQGLLDIQANANIANEKNLLQSYPLLISPDKKENIASDSGQVAPRTIVAKDDVGNILFIFTKNYYFSLYELQNYLKKSDLDLIIALNLDGGPSSGYSLNTTPAEISDSAEVPNVVMVFAK